MEMSLNIVATIFVELDAYLGEDSFRSADFPQNGERSLSSCG